ncbi:D-inositol-3-phosphate glycosyltransferase [Paenarthrobacter sp. MSM-2-10-13]|uniref:D-inositol-3-phosphate glycosyltransferase n=1 Tax=Micrococcaceae TaxID=1268 RepID=UPI00115EA754|nr:MULTISPECIES: D-inositol-3-phosphate glycosyltransferase [Micrococcaceae]MCM0615681.1 D-inositol-3-phosphate glycosyltransferase [Paenarthrobacter sp. TYUT067]NHW45497.1 D-inositol-3-phosphate glycosyltransferase [Paenarthrobacter sp. MSM-2-10-13]TQS92242.1 D-inositol-3-phosphate glycosyltransferase [Arthrobacter sp. TS-15]BCW63941.1 D-inositol 3-phosphate glycosyltransferase [Arthrobacter sp. StoSoilB22]
MPLIRRVAFLSLHTSPMEQPGAGDAGGMNVYVRALAMALAESGVEVEIFTRSTKAGQPAVEHPGPGVCVHNVMAGPRRKLPKEELPALLHHMVEEIDKIRHQQLHGRYDAIHSHYWVSGVAGLELSELWGVPLIHTMHTMAKVKNLVLESGERPEPRRREDGEQRIVDGASRLVANTPAEAEELVSHYGADPDRIDVAPPGVDLKVFTPSFRRKSRSLRGVRPDSFHILFAGRIQRLKGPQVFVKAAGILRKRRPDIDLEMTILGSLSGAKDFNLQHIIEDAGLSDVVTHRPPVVAPELASWFRSADVVVMPSFSESFGLVALEAQACGTPVVATNVGGLSRAISDGRTGILVNGHDPSDWADALEDLYDDVQTREDMGRLAATYAESFGWQRTAAITLESYREAVGGLLVPRR